MNRRVWFWVLFLVTLGIYLTIVLWSLPMISKEAAGLMPFDLRPGGYSEDEAREFLGAISDDGRAFYLGVQHWIDTAYPGLMAITLAFAINWAGQSWHKLVRFGLIGAGFVGAGFDYLENSRVANMLIQHVADVSAADIAAASQATLLKSGFGTLAMVGLFAGLIIRGYQRWRG